MTTEEVTILIESRIVSDGESENLSETAKGTVYDAGDHVYVCAKSAGDDGNSDLRLKIRDDSLEMVRAGEMTANMWFKVGAAREAVYKTPYGVISFMVETHKLTISKQCGDSGRTARIFIELAYSLMSEDKIVSTNEMSIKIQ